MSTHHKREFKAENGAITGHVDLVAEGHEGSCTHNWKWSTDGINYFWMRGTDVANTHYISGMPKGTKMYFIHELSINSVPESESQAYELIIA